MMKKIAMGIVTALVLRIVFIGKASADVMSFDVEPNSHSIIFMNGVREGLNTNIYLNAGDHFRVYFDPNDPWSCGWPPADFATNANGLSYGQEYSGYFFVYNLLVGRIDSGPYFGVGVNYDGYAQNSGTLYLMQWDCWYGDNSGFVTATVNTNTVPEPATILLFSLGFLGLAGVRRKLKK
jgi:hypothetical protein